MAPVPRAKGPRQFPVRPYSLLDEIGTSTLFCRAAFLLAKAPSFSPVNSISLGCENNISAGAPGAGDDPL